MMSRAVARALGRSMQPVGRYLVPSRAARRAFSSSQESLVPGPFCSLAGTGGMTRGMTASHWGGRSAWRRPATRWVGLPTFSTSTSDVADSSADDLATRRSDVLEKIFEWRKGFIAANGRNPPQEDIKEDPEGAKLMQEWVKLEDESGPDAKVGLSAEMEGKKKSLVSELAKWRAEFTESQGRAPSREDLFADPHASSLFQEFQKITELEWPDDMRLMLSTKIS